MKYAKTENVHDEIDWEMEELRVIINNLCKDKINL